MNPTIQPGMHPDAESLTAFAEHVLPLAEREEILAHMSACRRCREVVFLAQHAAEEDQSTPVVLVAEERSRPRKSWFDWRWAWIPAAACAGLIGVAVVQHNRRVATETQTAANVAPSDALRATVSGSVEEREFAPQTLARDEAKRLDANKPTDKKDVGVRATVPAILLAPGVSGGSTHGMMAARAKTSSIGGPSAANQFQQQNMANQQNTLQLSPGAQLDAANRTVKAAPAPQAESETVTVNAQAVAPAPARAATGAAQAQAPAQLSIPITEQSDAVSLEGVAGFSKKQKASLPSGLEALSVVSGADRTLALDTRGALFLSMDSGKHWKPVRTQWTGRAVLIRVLNTVEKGNALGAQGALKMSPTPKFELVTDDLQTWLSADGNIWTLQAMPGK